jgi:hypothetical protein
MCKVLLSFVGCMLLRAREHYITSTKHGCDGREAERDVNELTLFTGFAFALPLPVLGASDHISLTFSKTILQCLSKALTRPNNLRLFLQLINTCAEMCA